MSKISELKLHEPMFVEFQFEMANKIARRRVELSG
jgi:hypothetical protein